MDYYLLHNENDEISQLPIMRTNLPQVPWEWEVRQA